MSTDREPVTATIDLAALLSGERLQPFEIEARSRAVSVESVYVWNHALAAAFLGPLGMVEVAVRNGFDARLSASFGSAWYDNAAFNAIDITVGTPGYLKNKVDNAKRALRSKDPNAGPLSRSRVISSLSFAFWTKLVKPAYTRELWPTLRKGFPVRTKRSTVSGVLEPLVTFRNRVAHHEPIFNHAPERTLARLLKAADLLSPGLASWISVRSRIEELLLSGPTDNGRF